MASVESQLDQLVLSAHEIRALTGWPAEMIEDYLNIIRSLYNIASEADLSNDFIASVNQELSSLSSKIAKARSEHGKIRFDVDAARQEIAVGAVRLAKISAEMSALKLGLSGVSSGVSNNAAEIASVRAQNSRLESMIKNQEQIAHIVRT